MPHPPSPIPRPPYADPVLARVLSEVEHRFDADAAHDIGHCFALRLDDSSAGDASRGRRRSRRRCCMTSSTYRRIIPTAASRANVQRMSLARYCARSGSPRRRPSSLPRRSRSQLFARRCSAQRARARVARRGSSRGARCRSGRFAASRPVFGSARISSTPHDPWAVNRPLDDKRFSIDHFFTKLLKLPETFQTAEGRAEANRRVAIMHALLAALGEELA